MDYPDNFNMQILNGAATHACSRNHRILKKIKVSKTRTICHSKKTPKVLYSLNSWCTKGGSSTSIFSLVQDLDFWC